MAPSVKPRRHTRVPDLRAGDEVVVLKGKDAGKRGVIQKVLRHQQGWARSTERFGSGWQDRAPLSGAAVAHVPMQSSNGSSGETPFGLT